MKNMRRNIKSKQLTEIWRSIKDEIFIGKVSYFVIGN